MAEIVLMCDPRVADLPVLECGEPLVDVRKFPEFRMNATYADQAGIYAQLRAGLVERLRLAASLLPTGTALMIYEGRRPMRLQAKYFQQYAEQLRRDNPGWSDDHLYQQTSRSLSPPAIGPHVAGAAVDLTLCAADGGELDMGGRLNAPPEEHDGACYTAATNISAEGKENRQILCSALETAGLVNYPTEWWHWSYGDRYWAMTTGTPAAIYGPISG
ncbi:dipeptidase [Pseudonocardiaceae bacterium YIM PH 21723]|nr:dipeptidase [Pseudonocardiaceae bacterium YIM PH 21723]